MMIEITERHLLHMLKIASMIRGCEEALASGSEQKLFQSPVHLSIGQELISASLSCFFEKTYGDKVFGNHRSHGHYLAVTEDVVGLIHEVFGGYLGCSKNLGGSMHISNAELGFEGSVPIVSATVPLAVGSAIWIKDYTDSGVSIAAFGDGAVEEGVFHESLNLASQWDLPVLFLCENNVFSSHMHVSERQPSGVMSRFGLANQIEFETVDGNDVVDVYRGMSRAFSHIRQKRKPFFLECNTYRLRAHVGPTRDQDIGLHRSMELPEYEKNDVLDKIRGLVSVRLGGSRVVENDMHIRELLEEALAEAAISRESFDINETYRYLEFSNDN